MRMRDQMFGPAIDLATCVKSRSCQDRQRDQRQRDGVVGMAVISSVAVGRGAHHGFGRHHATGAGPDSR